MEMVPLGDSAIVVVMGNSINIETHRKVRQLSAYLECHPFAGMVEYVPTFTTVTIYYEGLKLTAEHADHVSPEDGYFPYQIAVELLRKMIIRLEDTVFQEVKTVEIPVCYGGDLGPDLEVVAAHNGLSTAEVIAIHSSADYLVYMLGFAPGFAYLGGMSERIATPRRQTPRLSIPQGSVAIAGEQTGVYPIQTPGGWQLIGKTPVALFLPQATPPTLLEAGNNVRFYPISRQDYDHWEETGK